MTPCPVIVFAKAPRPGLAKTRLIPALGEAGAAQLAERLLDAAMEQACAAAIGPVRLCCTPDATHPAFARWAQRPGVTLTLQSAGDLGQRMARALAQALAEHPGALLMGSDIPVLDAACLRQARDALAHHDAVFTPALDGGYVLVGLRRPCAALFENIPWSTPQVMAQTRKRLARLGLRHAELPPLGDVDEPADLTRLPPHWIAPPRR